jgi:rhodanese-related sulfurtransferase
MLNIFRQIGIILLLTGLGASYSLVSGLAPLPWLEPELGAGEIRVEDARVLDLVWIDARSEVDYDAGHISGAILLNEDDWDNGIIHLMTEWLNSPRPVVVYCGSESCGTSKRFAERLRDALPDAEIYSLHGGWDAWQE